METSVKYRSPHYRSGPRRSPVDTIVIHYISAVNIDPDDPFNTQKIMDLLTKPIPIGDGKSVKVSAHYAIDREGKVYSLVDTNNVAWHAGKSKLPNGKSYHGSCNEFSIGIELFGGKWIDFTDAQYDALVELTKHIKGQWDHDPDWHIVGHDTIAPGRKVDPGPRFHWERYLKALKEPEEESKAVEEASHLHGAALSSENEFEEEYRKNIDAPEDLKDPKHRIENNITDGKEKCWLARLFGK